MSNLNLYIRQNGSVKGLTVPTYVAKDLLNDNFPADKLQFVLARAKEAQQLLPHDVGLILIDFDRKAILSSQMSFSLEDLKEASKEELLKAWKYAELENAQEVSSSLQ